MHLEFPRRTRDKIPSKNAMFRNDTLGLFYTFSLLPVFSSDDILTKPLSIISAKEAERQKSCTVKKVILNGI